MKHPQEKKGGKRNFMKQPWNINRNGNLVLRYKGEQITAIERNGRYGFVYQDTWTWRYRNREIYDLETLKAAAFEVFDKE